MAHKSIWETSVTVHATLKEKTNTTLLEIAKEFKGRLSKAKIIEQLLNESPTFKNKMDELEKEDFFV